MRIDSPIEINNGTALSMWPGPTGVWAFAAYILIALFINFMPGSKDNASFIFILVCTFCTGIILDHDDNSLYILRIFRGVSC